MPCDTSKAQLWASRLDRFRRSGLSPWLPFESQEELEQARSEAEAEAEKLLEEAAPKSTSKPKKKRSEALPAHLPEVKQLCDVPEKDRVCPKHGPMAMIDVDKTETLVYEPAKLYRRVTEYPKYACTCCKEQGVVSAERPTGLVEGNKYDTSVAAAVVVHKFDIHLPLYRQTDVFGSSGLEHRQKHALPILEVIKKYVDSLTDAEVLPKSDLAGALGYLRNNWDALTTYASHGVLPIDNNRVE